MKRQNKIKKNSKTENQLLNPYRHPQLSSLSDPAWSSSCFLHTLQFQSCSWNQSLVTIDSLLEISGRNNWPQANTSTQSWWHYRYNQALYKCNLWWSWNPTIPKRLHCLLEKLSCLLEQKKTMQHNSFLGWSRNECLIWWCPRKSMDQVSHWNNYRIKNFSQLSFKSTTRAS